MIPQDLDLKENGCILKATNHGKFYPAPTEDVEHLLGLWTKWICLTVCLDFLVLIIHF